jgi:hypothetical protein
MLPSLAAKDQPLLVLVVAFLYSVEDQYSVGKQTAGNCGAIWQSGNLAAAKCIITGSGQMEASQPVIAALVRLRSSRT